MGDGDILLEEKLMNCYTVKAMLWAITIRIVVNTIHVLAHWSN